MMPVYCEGRTPEAHHVAAATMCSHCGYCPPRLFLATSPTTLHTFNRHESWSEKRFWYGSIQPQQTTSCWGTRNETQRDLTSTLIKLAQFATVFFKWQRTIWTQQPVSTDATFKDIWDMRYANSFKNASTIMLRTQDILIWHRNYLTQPGNVQGGMKMNNLLFGKIATLNMSILLVSNIFFLLLIHFQSWFNCILSMPALPCLMSWIFSQVRSTLCTAHGPSNPQ